MYYGTACIVISLAQEKNNQQGILRAHLANKPSSKQQLRAQAVGLGCCFASCLCGPAAAEDLFAQAQC